MSYAKHLDPSKTPQSEPIPGTMQVPNSAGGYSFKIDKWAQLDRFLILGAEGGSYYATERALTLDNADAVKACVELDGPRTVRRVVEISESGRAPKNEPAIMVLAYCAKKGDEATRRAAHAALPRVCRIGTHLHHFAEYVQAFGGWGRGTRNAVARWYQRDAKDVAHQVVKYQSRDGWSNRDLLRLSHPQPPTKEHGAIYNWIVKGEGPKEEWSKGAAVELIWAVEQAKKADVATLLRLIRDHRLPRECIPTEHLNEPRVWAALLEHMKPEAMIRNLAKMTAVGLLKPMSQDAAFIRERLTDVERLRKARLHPIKVLAALLTYASGHGVRGSLSWNPVQEIVSALDVAFYKTFETVEPTGKRTMLAMDVSGSMDGGVVAGVPGLSPRIASAAMAMVTAATEARHMFIGFASGGVHRSYAYGSSRSAEIVDLPLTSRMDLGTVCRTMAAVPFGGTDCALPMMHALERKLEVDTFVVYTDSETWAGNIHPVQALQKYRKETGIPAKLVVVGMVSNGFTIADPNDAGMLDVVGFDTAAPAVMADFARG